MRQWDNKTIRQQGITNVSRRKRSIALKARSIIRLRRIRSIAALAFHGFLAVPYAWRPIFLHLRIGSWLLFGICHLIFGILLSSMGFFWLRNCAIWLAFSVLLLVFSYFLLTNFNLFVLFVSYETWRNTGKSRLN
jgi:hypothetical protein